MYGKARKITSIFLCLCFLFNQVGLAQPMGRELNLPGFFANLSRQAAQDKFRPLHLRYLSYNSPDSSFQMLLDKGDSGKARDARELKSETKKLFDYFLVGLALPNEAFWVNLRPDSAVNIIDEGLEQTDVGRILLEADVQPKKDTASFTSPATPEGKQYWDALYKKAEDLFGFDSVTIPTLTRPWILPNEIIVRESQNNAYIYKATLKVCLEQDYLKDSNLYSFSDPRMKELNEYSSQLIRDLIIPKLTKEINTAKRYAALRQVYYSLILSQWFKAGPAASRGKYAGLINSRDLRGLTSRAPWSKDAYFKAYQASFKQGEYNIKEPRYTPYGQVIRSYTSGGIDFGPNAIAPLIETGKIVAHTSRPPAASSPVIAATYASTGEIVVVGEPVTASSPVSAELKAFLNEKSENLTQGEIAFLADLYGDQIVGHGAYPRTPEMLGLFADAKDGQLPAEVRDRLSALAVYKTYTREEIGGFRADIKKLTEGADLSAAAKIRLASFLIILDIVSSENLPGQLRSAVASILSSGRDNKEAAAYTGITWSAAGLPVFLSGLPPVEFIPGSAKGGVMIDAGCGKGLDSLVFAKKFPGMKVIAIDANAENIRVFYNALKQCGYRFNNLEIRVGDVNKESLTDNSADVVLFKSFFYVTNSEPKTLLEKISRVLRDGGQILIHGDWQGVRDAARQVRGLEILEEARVKEGGFRLGIVGKKGASASSPIGSTKIFPRVLKQGLLAQNQRHEAEVEKAERIWNSHERRLLEVGSSSANVARAIAEKNPELGVVATDMYSEHNEGKGQRYASYARQWEAGQLKAQRPPMPDNLAIARAVFNMDMLADIPDSSLDYILVNNPEREVMDLLLRNLGAVGSKLKPGGQLIIKPFDEFVWYRPKADSPFSAPAFDRINGIWERMDRALVSGGSQQVYLADAGLDMRLENNLNLLGTDLGDAEWSSMDALFHIHRPVKAVLTRPVSTVVSMAAVSSPVSSEENKREDANRRYTINRIVSRIRDYIQFDMRMESLINAAGRGEYSDLKYSVTLKELRRRLMLKNSLVAMHVKLSEGDLLAVFNLPNIKFLNTQISYPETDLFIETYQKILAQLLQEEGLITSREKGLLSQGFKQSKFVIKRDVAAALGGEAEVYKLLNLVATRLSETLTAYLHNNANYKDNPSIQSFTARTYFGLSRVSTNEDEAKIIADIQSLCAAKIARRQENGERGNFGAVFNQERFDALMYQAEEIRKQLGLAPGEMPPEEIMSSVRESSEEELAAAVREGDTASQNALLVKKYLDIIDLFDYPKSWQADLARRNEEKEAILNLLSQLESMISNQGPPGSVSVQIINQALAIIKTNDKNKSITSDEAFDYFAAELSRNGGTIVSADIIGFWAKIQRNLAQAHQEYMAAVNEKRGAVTSKDKQGALLDQALAADDKVKKEVSDKIDRFAEMFGGLPVVEFNGVRRNLVNQRGGDEIVFFMPSDYDWRAFAEKLSMAKLGTRILATGVNPGLRPGSPDITLGLELTEVTHDMFGDAYLTAQESDNLAKEVEHLGVKEGFMLLREPVSRSESTWFIYYHNAVAPYNAFLNDLKRNYTISQAEQEKPPEASSSPVRSERDGGLLRRATAARAEAVIQAYLDGDQETIHEDLKEYNDKPGGMERHLLEQIFPALKAKLPELTYEQINRLDTNIIFIDYYDKPSRGALAGILKDFRVNEIQPVMQEKEKVHFEKNVVFFKQGETLELDGHALAIEKVTIKEGSDGKRFFAVAVDKTDRGNRLFLRFIKSTNSKYIDIMRRLNGLDLPNAEKVEFIIPYKDGYNDGWVVATRFITGVQLGEYIRQIKGRAVGDYLPGYLDQIVKVGRSVLRLHNELGVPHDDLNFDNIMVTPDGTFMITDFEFAGKAATTMIPLERRDVEWLAALSAMALVQEKVGWNVFLLGRLPQWIVLPADATRAEPLDMTFASYADSGTFARLSGLINIIVSGLNSKLTLQEFVDSIEKFQRSPAVSSPVGSSAAGKAAALHFVLEETTRDDKGGYSQAVNAELERYVAEKGLLDPGVAITEQALKDIHSIVSKEAKMKYGAVEEAVPVEERGVYRQVAVDIGNTVAGADRIAERMQGFINWLSAAERQATDAEMFSAEAFLKFINIHPFINGNGRVARFLLDILLIRKDRTPVILTTYDFAFLNWSMTTYKRQWMLSNLIKNSQDEIAGNSRYQALAGRQNAVVSSPVRININSGVEAVTRRAVERFDPAKPMQCVDASRWIAAELKKAGMATKEREIFIPHDASKQAVIGDPTDSHTILEVVFGQRVWVIDTQLLQLTMSDRNKVSLPKGFVERRVYPAEEYYRAVPAFNDSICGERINIPEIPLSADAAESPVQLKENNLGTLAYETAIAEITGTVKNLPDKKILILINGNQRAGKTALRVRLANKELAGQDISVLDEDLYQLDFPARADQAEELLKMLNRQINSHRVVIYDGINSYKIYREKQKEISSYYKDAGFLVMNLSLNRPANADQPDISISLYTNEDNLNAGSLVSQSRPGGIDFRALPVTTQPALPAAAAAGALTQRLVSTELNIDPDQEWLQIREMLDSGIVPSNERIKEYAQACFGKTGSDADMDKVLSCIADILRMEEEQAETTDPQLRAMIALLESGRPANETRLALAKITFLEKEPELIEVP